jgi:tetratricopeptide (TPR) repeat protein
LSAEYYIKREEYGKAVSALKSAIDKGADSYVVWEQYLMIANFMGFHQEVKDIYMEAIQKFPDEINIYIFAGYSLYSLKDYSLIIDFEDRGRAAKANAVGQKVQFLNLLADSYREINNLAVSDSIYEEILAIDPNNLLIRNNYSYYLSIRSLNLKRAEELSRLTVKKEPTNATYLDTYGWILFKMGNYKEALKYVDLAIKNGAYNNAEVLDHYGDIMYELNRCSEAIEAWKEAIKYDESMIDMLSKKINDIATDNCNE